MVSVAKDSAPDTLTRTGFWVAIVGCIAWIRNPCGLSQDPSSSKVPAYLGTLGTATDTQSCKIPIIMLSMWH